MKMKKLLVTMAATAVAAAGVCATSAFADFPTQWNYSYSTEDVQPASGNGIYVTNQEWTTPKSGNYFLLMRYPAKETTGSYGDMTAHSEPMQLENGKEYKVTYWYFAQDQDDWTSHSYVRDAETGENYSHNIIEPGYGCTREGNEKVGYSTWYKQSFTFTYDSSKGSKPCLYFDVTRAANANKVVKYYFDDCSVVAVDDKTQTNLLPNGDFEEPSWKSAWGVYSNNGIASGDMYIDRANKNIRTGKYALHFVYPGKYGNKGNQIGAFSNTVHLEKGKTYNIMFKLVGSGQQEQLCAKFVNPNNVFETAKVNDTWEYKPVGGTNISGESVCHKMSFTANGDYDVRLALTLMNGAWGTGDQDLYVDDVFLVEENSDVNLIDDGSFEDNVGNDYWNMVYDNAPEGAEISVVNESRDGKHKDWWADGAKALNLYYPAGKGLSGTMTIWSKPIEGLEDGQEYTLSFYRMGSYAPESCEVGIMNENNAVIPLQDSKIQRVAYSDSALSGIDGKAEMNGIKYTFIYHKLSNQNPRFFITVKNNAWGDASDQYIDNVSLVKTGTTKNLIKDGSFEGITGKVTASNASISGDNTYMNSIIAKGTTTVSADVSNTTDSAKNVTLIAAYYNGDKLVALKTASDTVAADTEEKTISVDIDINEIDEDGSYKLKCFVWDSVDGMMPILNPTQSFSAMDMGE